MRQLAVGRGAPVTDGSQRLIDAAADRFHAIEIDGCAGEVDPVARQVALHIGDQRRDRARRVRRPGAGRTGGEPAFRRFVVGLRQLQGGKAALAPGHAADADCGRKQVMVHSRLHGDRAQISRPSNIVSHLSRATVAGL
jgi:hypothetical protein